MQVLKVLIIDDNFLIRDQIKKSLKSFEGRVNGFVKEYKLDRWRETKDIDQLPDIEKIDFEIYSADDGVEGLGYLYAIKPDLVIVDTTLPKYSGREIVDFIRENISIQTKVVALTDGEKHDRNLRYVSVEKKDDEFLEVLLGEVQYLLNIPKTHVAQGRAKWVPFVNNLINLSNRSDLLLSRYYRSSILTKLLILPYWIVLQLIISLMYFINTLLTGRSPKDESIEQEEKDLLSYRVRYYPTLITVFTTILILLVQVGLFVSGGLVIFNTRIESVFALAQSEKGYEFIEPKKQDYEYDESSIEITNEGLSLRLVEKELNVPEEDIPESYPQENVLTESYPDVLGASTKSSYSTDKPYVITKNPIKYSKLEEMYELSSINSEGSSTLTREEYEKQLEKLEQSDPRNSTKITYQLSPNKTGWYYWNGNSWENTKQGWVSSNTIQEINENLESYEESLGTGELYLKIFLHSSNGEETPILKEIVVEREQEMVSQVVTKLPEVQVQEQSLGSVDFEVLEPVILNAAYVSGEKVIKGKLLPKNRLQRYAYQITQEELGEYEVNIYYSDQGQATKNSLIGTTNLYLNQKGVPEFFLRTSASDGGYVTAQVVRKVSPSYYTQELPESYIVENPAGASDLASPLKNSSFVVTSTGDGADTSAGDASCDDGSGECTLRAAIEESNALGGLDNIYFDIPVTDPNYLDYDNPTAGSNSGDSTDRDDYWSVQPGSALPQISESLTIDGSSVNGTDPIANTNTSGPEIEINGYLTTGVEGISVNSSNTTINAVVINRFSLRPGVFIDQSDNITLTNSYLGTDVSGLVGFTTDAERLLYGVHSNLSDNVIIGTSNLDKNVISANRNWNILMDCGTTGVAKTFSIAGNYIGLDKNGDQSLVGSGGIQVRGDCRGVIGGDSTSNRNYLGSVSEIGSGIWLDLSENDIPKVEIYNNFIGTDITGTRNRGFWGTRTLVMEKGGADFVGTDYQSIIGAENKGNLIRFGAVRLYNGRNFELAYNTIADSDESGLEIYGRDASLNYKIDIHHNFIGQSESDPYFGISVGSNNWAGGHIGNLNNSKAYNNIISHNEFNMSAVNNGSFYNNEIINGSFGTYSTSNVQVFNNKFSEKSDDLVYVNLSGGVEDAQLATENDLGDADTGPNALQNFPIISEVTNLGGNQFQIKGGLDGNISEAPFSIEICRSEKRELGRGGCLETLKTITTNSSADYIAGASNWYRFDTIVETNSLNADEMFSALATNNNNSTSEFGIYSDANPVMQDDGSSVIIVNSTSDEDNVSTLGFDEGSGTHSGGGVKGPDGPADGKTSLREAIIVANNHPGPDKIHFNIPTNDVGYSDNYWHINASTILPSITDEVEIDGYTQTGASINTNPAPLPINSKLMIEISLNEASRVLHLSTGSDNSRIRGLAINSLSKGLTFGNGASDIKVQGSFLGTDITGTVIKIPSEVFNIFNTSGDGHVIGQESDDDHENRNVMAGKGYAMITGSHEVSEPTIIKGNYIGVNKNGKSFSEEITEHLLWLRHKSEVSDNVIGNAGRVAVVVTSEYASDSTVTNNFIGTNIDGDILSNNWTNQVWAGAVLIENTSDVLVKNNRIENSVNAGILVSIKVKKLIVKNNTIKNNTTGILIPYTNSDTTSKLENNIINDNEILDIDIGIDNVREQVNENDPGDIDIGANNLMNYPVIEEVQYLGAGEYMLYGSLDNDVAGESPFEIEICESYEHESGHGGCLDTLGYTSANSPWEAKVTFEGDDGTQERIFSTLATNAKGSTSEFSKNFKASSDNPNYYIIQYPIELVYPIEGERIVDRTPLLDWNANSDPDLDHWEVYLGRSAETLQKVGEIEGSRTNFQVSKGLPLDYTTYYWKVVDIRRNGTIGGESDVESFKVIENLQHLNLVHPTGGVKIDETKPTFKWTKSSEEDVIYYELYLREKMPDSYAQSQGNLISQENKLARIEGREVTEYQSEEALKLADYEWQVVAYFADAKESGRSEVGDFSIIVPEVTVTQGRVKDPMRNDSEDDGRLGQAKGITVEQAVTICCLCLCCMVALVIVLVILWKRKKKEATDSKEENRLKKEAKKTST
jgi:CSLREA domain-containing protein